MRKPTKKIAKKLPKAAAQSAIDQAALSALRDLESPIRDLERAALVAYLMTMHDDEYGDDEHHESLGLFAVEQFERLATELREQFYRASEGKAVRS
jgi:hypothetical protein